MNVTKWVQVYILCLQMKAYIEESMWWTMIKTTSGAPDWSTPFLPYAEESLSTLTTPLFVNLINCIWYLVCVSGHYSLTSLPKPVCQGFYHDSEGLHWIYARDRNKRIHSGCVECNPTAMLLVEWGVEVKQEKICEEGQFGKYNEANVRNTFPTLLSIIHQ